MTLLDQLRTRKSQQFALLRALYEHRADAPLDPAVIVGELGLEPTTMSRALRYSDEEGLIGRDASNSSLVALTAYGKAVIETALARPNESTEHFPALTTLELALPATSAAPHREVPESGDVRAA